MNFVELKEHGEDNMSIHIHTMMITALEEAKPKKTILHLMGGQIFVISESVSEIKKKIKESEMFKLTTFNQESK